MQRINDSGTTDGIQYNNFRGDRILEDTGIKLEGK